MEKPGGGAGRGGERLMMMRLPVSSTVPVVSAKKTSTVVFLKNEEERNPAVPVGFCPGLLIKLPQAGIYHRAPPTQSYWQLFPGLLHRPELWARCPGV